MTAILIIIFILALIFLIFRNFSKALVNRVRLDKKVIVSVEAREIHRNLLIGDMHADSLLYNNGLLDRSWQGHVDVPRLIEGNVAIQVFTCVSRFPLGANVNSTGTGADLITAGAVLQGWPRQTWGSLYQRALFQAEKFNHAQQTSDGRLLSITSRHDLERFLNTHKQQSCVGGILGLEGGHCLEGKLENLDALYAVGYRLLSPTHFFDNELGGSMHGKSKQGLTPFGREVVQRMLSLNMLIDLAHASTSMIDDVLAIVDRSVIISHTGVKGVCDNNRNLSDEYLHKIAATGGLVGIGFWNTATGSNDVAGIVRSIRYAVDRIGIDHVGIGSDYDGSVCVPFDTRRMILLTQRLLEAGFSEEEISRIMGGNFIHFLSVCLP